MNEFNKRLSKIIGNDDKQAAREWVQDMFNEWRYTEPSRVRIAVLKRQMRILNDWLADCDKYQ